MFVYICISFLRIQNLFCKSNIKEALLNETDDFVIRAALRIGWAPDLQGVVLVEGGCERCKRNTTHGTCCPAQCTQLKLNHITCPRVPMSLDVILVFLATLVALYFTPVSESVVVSN